MKISFLEKIGEMDKCLTMIVFGSDTKSTNNKGKNSKCGYIKIKCFCKAKNQPSEN